MDGDPVATHDVTIADAMRPLASDVTAGGPDVAVQWLRMSPYAASGTFLSRVFDGAPPGTDWLTLARTASVPAGASLTFATRSGDTATPGAGWSDWEPLGAGGAVASPNARHLQYRAVLASSDDTATPTLQRVTIGHTP